MDGDTLFAGKPVWIISDVHLGAPQCQLDDVTRFLDALPDTDGLILNGDTLDRHFNTASAPPGHVDMLRRLEAESRRRRVVWLRGNNDPSPESWVADSFVFGDSVRFGQRLHVEHGDRFDHLRPPFKPLLYRVQSVYDRVSCGRGLHITTLASRLPFVFRVLTRHMARHASVYARAHGIAAVACGHSHDAADRMANGVRYLNTGCWAGTGAWVVMVSGATVAITPTRRYAPCELTSG